MDIYIYALGNGKFLRNETGSPTWIFNDLKDNEDFTLTPQPDYEKTWRWIDTEWVELLPINNPDIKYDDTYVWSEALKTWVESPELQAYQYLEDQLTAWYNIQAKRLKLTSSGVYVPSIDAKLHTDNTSTLIYSQIGSAINLGIFQPIMWKTMEGIFIEMNKELFREFQVLLMQQTQAIYARAEYHKLMMESMDNPLDYNFEIW